MSRGFTLVEVVIALVVLEVGVLGVLGVLVLASRTLADAEIRERTVLEALRIVDSLAVHEETGPGGSLAPWGTVRWPGPLEDPRAVVALDARGDTLVVLSLPGAP